MLIFLQSSCAILVSYAIIFTVLRGVNMSEIPEISRIDKLIPILEQAVHTAKDSKTLGVLEKIVAHYLESLGQVKAEHPQAICACKDAETLLNLHRKIRDAFVQRVK